MKKHIKVNHDLCIACSTCQVIDPAHFGAGTSGKAMVKNGESDIELAAEKIVDSCGACEDAAASCPVGAISVEDAE